MVPGQGGAWLLRAGLTILHLAGALLLWAMGAQGQSEGDPGDPAPWGIYLV